MHNGGNGNSFDGDKPVAPAADQKREHDMGEGWFTTNEALAYLNQNGFKWSRKTLLNRSSGAQASIRKTRRGMDLYFNKADLDAFIRAETRVTHAYGVR